MAYDVLIWEIEKRVHAERINGLYDTYAEKNIMTQRIHTNAVRTAAVRMAMISPTSAKCCAPKTERIDQELTANHTMSV